VTSVFFAADSWYTFWPSSSADHVLHALAPLAHAHQIKSFEVSYVMTQSRGVWLFAMEWWFMGFGMITACFLNARSKILSVKWTVCSGLIACMSILGFAAEILRLRNWVTASEIDVAVAILVGFILLPVWLVWVGAHLKNLREEAKEFVSIPISGPHRDGGDAYGAQSPVREAEMSQAQHL